MTYFLTLCQRFCYFTPLTSFPSATLRRHRHLAPLTGAPRRHAMPPHTGGPSPTNQPLQPNLKSGHPASDYKTPLDTRLSSSLRPMLPSFKDCVSKCRCFPCDGVTTPPVSTPLSPLALEQCKRAGAQLRGAAGCFRRPDRYRKYLFIRLTHNVCRDMPPRVVYFRSVIAGLSGE